MGALRTNRIVVLVTAQLFLDSSVPLDVWLVDQKLRPEVAYRNNGEKLDWHGIQNWERWLSLVSSLAIALNEILGRRAVHGDIWPPNIFMKSSVPPVPVFIDFGESFLVFPNGEPRTQRNHAYRAPERESGDFLKTEQVDVYSFGKLMLYLTVGKDCIIPRPDGRLIYGHDRRHAVRNCSVFLASEDVRFS
jgi:hypothetical protein